MIRKHLLLSLFSTIFIVMVSANSFAQTIKTDPTGRYCGEVLHLGRMEKAEVILNQPKDGRINGKIIYRDGDNITEGTIEEPIKGEGTERTIEWKDKYGSGLAIWKFDENFEKFNGLWGAGLQVPQHLWTGKRCDEYTS